VRTYASSLTVFREQNFDFRPLRMKPGDTEVTVLVRVLQTGSQPVNIEYDMEKTARGWKVYDVRIAGISLVANYRTEFANVVRQSGVDGLIAALEKKNKSVEASAAK
jgi:phospholipid transport system substrate-binding protein